jgi:hypothetical protein
MAHEKWGDIVEDELGSAPVTTRTLSGVLQEVSWPPEGARTHHQQLCLARSACEQLH